MDILRKFNSIESIMDMVEMSWISNSSETALMSGDEKITYLDLKNRVSEISSILIQNYSDEDIIAVSTLRSNQVIINILAILKAGKTYLPLDFNFPEKRIAQIVSDCGVKYYLKSGPDDLLPLEPVDLNSPVEFDFRDETRYSRLAYILYTSGSTGLPKGVCVPHAGIVNLINWQIGESISGPGINTLQFTRLSFDISVQEIFSTLCSGGTLHIVDTKILRDNQLLIQALIDRKIHRLFLPFVALQGIANEAENSRVYPKFLKEVMTCGEQLKSTRAIKNLFLNVEKARLFNQYGPTECTCIVTQLALERDPELWDDLPTIGKSIAGVEAMILDEKLSPISEYGKSGEVYFSGVCLADGYLNQKELTEKSFFSLPHSGQKVYKTGDLGYWTEQREIFFLGRIDDQIKINGFRIETGEIEAVAAKLSGVTQVAIIVGEYEDGQKYLKLFFVSETNNISETDLLEFLKQRLPEYMIPSFCIRMQEFPQTTNGKIDRKLLSTLKKAANPNSLNYSKPRNKVEKSLALIWQVMLGLDRVGRDDHFFELGGSSILAQKLAIQINQIFKKDFSVTKIYQFPKLSSQAEFLEKTESSPRRIISKENNSRNRDVAVIATAGRFPGASDCGEFWDLLIEGKESIRFFELEELEGNELKLANENHNYIKARGIIEDIKMFDSSFFGLNHKIAEVMDPQQRLFLEVAYEVLDSAGYIAEKPEGKVGVFAGCSSNAYYQKNIVFDNKLPELLGALQIMSVNEKDYLASRVAYQLDLRGPAISVHTACSTSLVAVANAVQSIRNGECELAIAGGSSVAYPINSGHLFEEGSILSKDGHCRPFDASASGTLFSDGAGAVLLKDYEQAVASGDQILAVIKGVGINNDGFTKSSFSAPSIEGQAEAILMAHNDAQISPDLISYIEAHGTATPIGDPIEIEALKLAFGSDVKTQSCAIGSVKGNIGHLNAAAGIAGFIKTVQAIHHRTIPASIGYEKPNPSIDFEKSPFFVNSTTIKWESDQLRRAGVSSFGIGGTNCHVVLEEFLNDKKFDVTEDNLEQTVFFSAKTEQSLLGYAVKLKDFVLKNPSLNLIQFGYNINRKNPGYKLGIALKFKSFDSLISGLDSIISGEKLPVKRIGNFNFPIFLFPGQGAQYLNMGRDLYDKEVVFSDYLDQCDVLFSEYLDVSIHDLIFSSNPDEKMELRLSDTRYTQPVIFSVSYALAKLWISKGVNPSVLCGHSIGEFVAACLANIIDLNDAVKIIAKRGELISKLPIGSMLSIRSAADNIIPLLRKGLSLAADNAPNLCVVSGPTELIEDFATKLEKRGIPSKILKTSHAFHSVMMEPAMGEFNDFLRGVKLNNPQIPILSTVTGNWLKDSEATSPEYWAQHMRLPVLFSKAVSKLMDEMPEGAFLEAGPGNNLSTLFMQHSDAKIFPVVNSLSKTTEKFELQYFDSQFQKLVNMGLRLNWNAIYPESAQIKFAIPSYSFDKRSCWIDVNPIQPSHKAYSRNEVQDNGFSPALHHPSINKTSSMAKQLWSILEETSGAEIGEKEFSLSFFELGLDSLTLTQVAFLIKKTFNVPISFKQLSGELSTPLALLDFLRKNSSNEKNKEPQTEEFYTTSKLQVSKSNLTYPTDNFFIGELEENNIQNQFGNLPITSDISFEIPSIKTEKDETFSTELSEVATNFIEKLITNYNSKTAKSKAYSKRNEKYPLDLQVLGGINSFKRELNYSIISKSTKGSGFTDLDDNNFLDWMIGFGSSLFGYFPDFISTAISAHLDQGIEKSHQQIVVEKLSEQIGILTNNEQVKFCNSNIEAINEALKIARKQTKRALIVCFSGSIHEKKGMDLMKPKGLENNPYPGRDSEKASETLILEYGTTETLQKIKQRANQIAAVLVEPVQISRPEFVPIEFLQTLREIADEENICLIFDENFTGFRSHIGGFQTLYNVKADLTAYGKVLGEGFSVGILAGKSKWMESSRVALGDVLESSVSDESAIYSAEGSIRHPLILMTMNSVLNYLIEKGDSFQERMADLANEMVSGANVIFQKYNVPYYAVNFRSLWRIKSKNNFPFSDLLFIMLRERNVHIWEEHPCFVTESHSSKDIQFTLKQLEEVVRLLVENEITEGDLFLVSHKWMNQENPPFEDAIITLNDEGFPIWVRKEAYVEPNVIRLQSIFL